MTDWPKELARHINNAPLAKTFGWRLTFDEQEHAHVHLPYNPDLDHAFDGIHGGVMATLLDSAGWCASAVRHPKVWVSTAQFNVHLVRQAARCDLRAEGWVVHSGKRMDVVEMNIVGEEDGKLYATGSGSIVVLNIPFGDGNERTT
jgi:uncharacterized protein (TIGR00369 family)